MGKSKKTRSKSAGPSAAVGNHAKERHKRDQRGISVGAKDLKGTLEKPKGVSKHKVYYERVPNTEKKLDFEFCRSRIPPALFEFVPLGNPALTDKCKELSREQGAMIYIVAPRYYGDPKQLSVHVDRIGHHFRQAIVQEARKQLPQGAVLPIDVDSFLGAAEPIPKTQKEIDAQADQHILELFPRIPNFDRQAIINRAFDLSKLRGPERPPVGLAPDLPLTRRVQLAVLAHIRHTHTPYDQMLKSKHADREEARRIIESTCLDILVKWRGDEENGRDQMKEFVREVIIISDSESDDDEDDDLDDEDSDTEDEDGSSEPQSPLGPPGGDAGVEIGLNKHDVLPGGQQAEPAPMNHPKEDASRSGPRAARKVKKKKAKRRTNKDQRGLSRYYAAWDRLQAYETNEQAPPSPAVVMSRSASYGSYLPRYAPSPPSPVYRDTYRDAYRDAYRDLDSPINKGEILRYDDSPPERFPTTGYRQQGSHVDAARYHDEAQPIVGSPVIRDAGIVVRRVRYQDEDLKDHLVKSIEPTSPDVSSFPVHPQGPSHWEQHRIRSAPEVQYERPRPVESSIPGFRHYYGYHDLRPRDQVLVDTGFSSQPILPARSQPHGVARTFTPPGVTPALSRAPLPAYRPNPPSALASSGPRRDPEVICIDEDKDDDDLLRTKARPIVIQDEYGHTQQVMVDSRPPPQPVETVAQDRHEFTRPEAYHARGEDRLTGAGGNVISQGFSEIVRVSNKFPRRHESQRFPPETGGYVTRPPGIIQYRHENIPDTSAPRVPPPSYVVPRTRVKRVVAMVEEPVRQYPYQPDVPRPLGSIPVAVQRQERVVGLEYVPATAHGHGVRRFTSPIKMDGDGGGHPSGLTSVAPMNSHSKNHRVASDRDYRRADGVIELNQN